MIVPYSFHVSNSIVIERNTLAFCEGYAKLLITNNQYTFRETMHCICRLSKRRNSIPLPLQEKMKQMEQKKKSTNL